MRSRLDTLCAMDSETLIPPKSEQWSYIKLTALGIFMPLSLWVVAAGLPQAQLWRVAPVAVLLALLTVSAIGGIKVKYRWPVLLAPLFVTAIVVRVILSAEIGVN